jgi:hypothetical protein
MIDTVIAATGEVALIPGCILGLEMAIADDAGTTQALTGRRWYMTIWRLSDNAEIQTVTTDAVTDSSGTYAPLWFDGAATRAIYDAQRGNSLSIEWGELLAPDNRAPWESRCLKLMAGPATVTGTGSGAAIAAATRVVRNLTTARLSYVARGLPGLSAATQLANTPDPANPGHAYISTPTVEAMDARYRSTGTAAGAAAGATAGAAAAAPYAAAALASKNAADADVALTHADVASTAASAALAQAWAESGGAPGGGSTQSAKAWALASASSAAIATAQAAIATTQAGIATTQATNAAASAALAASYAIPAALATGIGSVTIPAAMTAFRTTGFRTLGKGAAIYTRATGLPSWGQNIWWFADATGAQFQICEGRPDLLMFGGYDDGAKPYASRTVTGTDNAPAMNALLYYCQYYGYSTAWVPAGKYTFYDTIHAGFGGGTLGQYSHINIRGAGALYAGHSILPGFPGTALYSAFSDRPLLSVQGQRDCTISDMTFVGLYSKYIIDNNLAVTNGLQIYNPSFDDRDISNWWDPNLSPMQDGRYTPYAAIAVDPFSGTRPSLVAWAPSTAYQTGDVRFVNSKVYVARNYGTSASSGGPSGTTATEADGTMIWVYMGPYSAGSPNQYVSYNDVSYPSYSGVGSTQYGKGQSSKITVERCNFEGFVSTIVVQPSGFDGNGDFLTVKDCLIQFTKYAVEICQTQSRNVHVTNVTGNQIFTFLEGAAHGKRQGRFQGPVINLSLSNTMNLFNALAAYLAELTFQDCYIESLDRLGNLMGSAGKPVIFIAGDMNMLTVTYNNFRGVPDNHLSGSTTRHTGATSCSSPIMFIGTALNFERVCVLLAQDLYTRSGLVQDVTNTGTHLPFYVALANNALAGGLVTPQFGSQPSSNKTDFAHQFIVRNVTDGNSGGVRPLSGGLFGDAQRIYGSPFYIRKLQMLGLNAPVDVGRKYSDLPKQSRFPDLALNGRILTGTFFQSPAAAESAFLMPGDVLLDESTGKTFFIYSFDTTTKLMKAYLQNGFTGPAGSETIYGTFSTTVGNFTACTGRRCTFNTPLFVSNLATKTLTGDLTNGSTKIQNVARASLKLLGLKVTGGTIPAGSVVIGVDGSDVYISGSGPTANATGASITFGTSSPLLRDCGDAQGVAGASTYGAIVGDYIDSDPKEEGLATDGVTFSAFDDTAQTITLTGGNPLWPPRNNFRLKSFRMAPPANAATP